MDNLTPDEFEAKVGLATDEGRMVIIMFQDEDGNWRGLKRKDFKFAQTRDVGPETVLQQLLTHQG